MVEREREVRDKVEVEEPPLYIGPTFQPLQPFYMAAVQPVMQAVEPVGPVQLPNNRPTTASK